MNRCPEATAKRQYTGYEALHHPALTSGRLAEVGKTRFENSLVDTCGAFSNNASTRTREGGGAP